MCDIILAERMPGQWSEVEEDVACHRHLPTNGPSSLMSSVIHFELKCGSSPSSTRPPSRETVTIQHWVKKLSVTVSASWTSLQIIQYGAIHSSLCSFYKKTPTNVADPHRTTFEKCATWRFLLCCYVKIYQLFFKLSGGIFQCWIAAIWGLVQVYLGARLMTWSI